MNGRLPDAPVICAFGIRGSGKTTLARRLSNQAPRVVFFDPFTEYEALSLAWDDALEYFDGLPDLSCFRIALSDEPDGQRFGVLARELAERVSGLLVVLEEADLVAPPGREPPAIRRLIAQGRHLGVSLLGVSRRPAEVSRLLTSQASDLYLFQLHEPADVTYLGSVAGRKLAQRLPTLPLLHYLHWTPAGVKKGRVHPGQKIDIDTEMKTTEPLTG